MRSFLQCRIGSVIAIAALAVGSTVTPVRADTTVAEYVKLDKPKQAHLLGSLLQSLADDLEANNRGSEATCLTTLYTPQSEARRVRSLGMMDFLQSVEFAREDDPAKTTLEQIIARQMYQYCGVGRK